jgi:hypothetical protein
MSPIFPPPQDEAEGFATLAKVTGQRLLLAAFSIWERVKRPFSRRNAKPS